MTTWGIEPATACSSVPQQTALPRTKGSVYSPRLFNIF